MKYKAVRGMEDTLPQDIGIWQELERRVRKELEFYGYAEIRTPIIEDTALFIRSIGETSDIVTKEMFTFKDRKDRSLTLRPEGTAPIVRSYIEHSLDQASPVLKLYYIGPMFRSERPQKGRSRQFHQIGVEIFGANSPFQDAEVIMQVSNLLRLLGLSGFTFKLNSLGCKEDKLKFSQELKKYLNTEKNRLCQDCKNRVKKNVLRVLDCKNESCIQVVKSAPNLVDSLCAPCKDHFGKVKSCLGEMKINFKESKNLVRGLDYYTGTVFEITHPALGGQDAIGAGGRYDGLVKDFGGPDVPAVGYALGIERIIIALKKELPISKVVSVVYVATLGDRAQVKGIQLVEKIKEKLLEKVIVLTDPRGASLKSQMRIADKNKAKIVIILGEDELEKGKAIIRDMETKEQKVVDLNNVTEELIARVGRD